MGIATNSIWSYLLWSPVIGQTDHCLPDEGWVFYFPPYHSTLPKLFHDSFQQMVPARVIVSSFFSFSSKNRFLIRGVFERSRLRSDFSPLRSDELSQEWPPYLIGVPRSR